MRRIKDHNLPAIRESSRSRAAGPFLCGGAQQVLASRLTKSTKLFEIDDKKIRKTCEAERIERRVRVNSRKIAKTQSLQLILAPFCAGW